MPYTNCLTIADLKYLNVFDEMIYAQIKDFIKNDDNDVEVEITDLECERVCWCRTQIKFEFEIPSSLSFYVPIKKTVILEYNNSSPIAMYLVENCCYESDEEEDSDDEEDRREEHSDDERIRMNQEDRRQEERIYEAERNAGFHEEDHLERQQ